MNSFGFESGIYKKDPIFQMRDYRIMSDAKNVKDEQAQWWGMNIDDGDPDTPPFEYVDSMIAIISVNCTTINMEFNPNDPKNNQLFDFDPIRYMCIGSEA